MTLPRYHQHKQQNDSSPSPQKMYIKSLPQAQKTTSPHFIFSTKTPNIKAKMTFTIRPATEHDAAELATINIASFRHQPFWKNLFPSATNSTKDITTALPLKTARCLSKLAAPEVHVLVATDTTTGKIIGYARWAFPASDKETSIVELSAEGKELFEKHDNGKAFPEDMRRDVYEAFWKMLKDKSEVLVQEKDFVLEFLATLPEAQGKGVGTALLKWGIEQADKRNARVYLEATEDGYALYKKYGWEDLEVMEMDFEEFGGAGRQKWIAMMRGRAGEGDA
ncbi:acyl-CoA N-acyltransferase [Aspergillus sclerotioniger CBS 115572]|uniref:Acyl-CoA N-acyltransferase n=1 Tax=Aspergillus sclerotioniger CBS 115572 TaxID=1450535 RepID=A0A317X464_9EURO|nr:acyl-CoA N-acyltransferase [Aspergillus sclerotioniger CBS 115572]PWY93424.1 acyl-CoA N-acyltransferase [Aspergillus sclerotioniger CBS 115572]